MQRKLVTSKKGVNKSYSESQTARQNCLVEIMKFEKHLCESMNLQGVKISAKNFRETRIKDDAEARNDFWSIEGDFIYRHHVEHRVQLHVPKFPIPLKYIDVTRSTHTILDVMQEKRNNDFVNVDGERTLSDSETGFTEFTFLIEKLLAGYMLSPGCTWQRSEQLPDQIFVGLRFGMACRKQQKTRTTRMGY